MGGQAIWGCLKYFPHRLAGAELIAPATNFWWPGFPANLSAEALYSQQPADLWTLRVARYAPWLTYWWNTQKWFPYAGVITGAPEVFSRLDLEFFEEVPERLEIKPSAIQQGEFESLHMDLIVGFGRWEFDPMDIENPFPNQEGSVHIWQGDEDRMVPVILQRYIAQKLPWIHYHELPGSGHMLTFIPHLSERIVKSLLLGEK